jgi:hypothetical protein
VAWPELLESFQGTIAACIAAFVGLSGIIITIRANARLAEKERKEQRSQQKDALIAILYSELITIKNIIDDNLTKLKRDGGYFPSSAA